MLHNGELHFRAAIKLVRRRWCEGNKEVGENGSLSLPLDVALILSVDLTQSDGTAMANTSRNSNQTTKHLTPFHPTAFIYLRCTDGLTHTTVLS